MALRYLQSKVVGNKGIEFIWRAYRYREGLFQPADERIGPLQGRRVHALYDQRRPLYRGSHLL